MDKHAARQGDDIIHSSIFADITSIVAEGAVYAAMGAIVAGVATVAAPLVGVGALAAVGSSCLLSGIIAGAVANVAGITDDISAAADGIGDMLFPPSPAGVIASGSDNVIINGLAAARAAGELTAGDTPPPEAQSAGFLPTMPANCWRLPTSSPGRCGSRRLPPLPQVPRHWNRIKLRARNTAGHNISLKDLKAYSSTASRRHVLKIAPPVARPSAMMFLPTSSLAVKR